MENSAAQNDNARPLRKSQRNSRTNLSRISISPQKSNNIEQLHTKPYELNMDKAIEKKLNSCTSEHIRVEVKPRNNMRIFLSTSAYELIKKSLPTLLQNYTDEEGLTFSTEKGLDKGGSEVEIRFRVLNQLKSGKTGSQVKFTINCYHTSSSMLVNGSKLDLFNDHILPKIEEEIQNHHDRLDTLNLKVQNSINNIHINNQQCHANIGTSKTNDSANYEMQCITYHKSTDKSSLPNEE